MRSAWLGLTDDLARLAVVDDAPIVDRDHGRRDRNQRVDERPERTVALGVGERAGAQDRAVRAGDDSAHLALVRGVLGRFPHQRERARLEAMVQRVARLLDVEDGAEDGGAGGPEVQPLLLPAFSGARRAGGGRRRRLRRLRNPKRCQLGRLLPKEYRATTVVSARVACGGLWHI